MQMGVHNVCLQQRQQSHYCIGSVRIATAVHAVWQMTVTALQHAAYRCKHRAGGCSLMIIANKWPTVLVLMMKFR